MDVPATTGLKNSILFARFWILVLRGMFVLDGFVIQISWSDFPGNSPLVLDVALTGCSTSSIPRASLVSYEARFVMALRPLGVSLAKV